MGPVSETSHQVRQNTVRFLLGLIIIWGINISRQKTAMITMLAKKRKYFRERLARKRLNALHR